MYLHWSHTVPSSTTSSSKVGTIWCNKSLKKRVCQYYLRRNLIMEVCKFSWRSRKQALSALPDLASATHLALSYTSVHIAFLALDLLAWFWLSGSTILSSSSGSCKYYSFCLEHFSLPTLLPLVNIVLDILQTRKDYLRFQGIVA